MSNEFTRYRYDVSFEDLQTFIAVTECRSFRRAAERLRLSQPSVSNRIRRLEEKLLTRLIDRSYRTVDLTPQGHLLYSQSSEPLAQLHMLQKHDVSLEDIQTFLAITELGSFSRTAEQLNLSQPAISIRIRRLQEKLRTPLLDRTRGKVELTPKGECLYLQSSKALARLRFLLSEVTGEAATRAREVHVAATMTMSAFGLPSLIRLFHEKHPNVRATVHELFPREIAAKVISGDCDLAVMSQSEPVKGVRFELLLEDTCVVVTHRSHPMLRHHAVPLSEVLAEPLLNPKGSHDLSLAIYAEAACHGLDVHLAPEAHGVRNTFTLLAMAAAGLGVCIHPSSFIPTELRSTIGVVPLRDAAIGCTFGLIARQFRDFMLRAVKLGPHPWHPPDDEISPGQGSR